MSLLHGDGAGAGQGMQLAFQSVLDVGIERLGLVTLRVEIADTVGAAQLQRDDVVNLVLARFTSSDPV